MRIAPFHKAKPKEVKEMGGLDRAGRPRTLKRSLGAALTMILVLTGALFPALAIKANAAPATNYFSTPGFYPCQITTGPNGTMWVTDCYSANVGILNTDGSVTEFNEPSLPTSAASIAVDNNGNAWTTYAEQNDAPGGAHFAEINETTPTGTVTVYTLPNSATNTMHITLGPDGALWFTEFNTHMIGRIATSGDITEYPLPSADFPWGITAGPDGNLWFTNLGSSTIGRITPAGVETDFPTPISEAPFYITAGPDGNLWFTDEDNNNIGRITTSGQITEYPISGVTAGAAITAGPDGALWFAAAASNQNIVGRITTDGQASLIPVTSYPELDLLPRYLTFGSDGNLWFAVTRNPIIGQLVIPEQPAATMTAMASSVSPSVPGQAVTYTATVSPVPHGGTVSFADGTAAIAGCGAQPVDPSTGQATCETSPGTTGTHSIAATFSGSTGFAASTSTPLAQVVVPTCPSGTSVHIRWHYRTNGSAGGWSGTKAEPCPGPITMGPQAMEGHLQVAPGATLQAGYDFTIPGDNNSVYVTFTGPEVTFTGLTCANGDTPTSSIITLPMPHTSYNSTNGGDWYPSGDQSSSLVYQGSITVPNLCNGGDVDLANGGTFTAGIS